MFCTNCGHKLAENEFICSNCGMQIPIKVTPPQVQTPVTPVQNSGIGNGFGGGNGGLLGKSKNALTKISLFNRYLIALISFAVAGIMLLTKTVSVSSLFGGVTQNIFAVIEEKPIAIIFAIAYISCIVLSAYPLVVGQSIYKKNIIPITVMSGITVLLFAIVYIAAIAEIGDLGSFGFTFTGILAILASVVALVFSIILIKDLNKLNQANQQNYNQPPYNNYRP